jgi:pimeloyl-ACP methyl ester carboxylesterase
MATRVDKLVLVSAAILWNELRRARPIATFANLAQAVGAAVSARWELAVTRPRLRGWSLMNVVRHPLRLPPELAYEVMSGSGKPGFVPALNALASYRIRDRLPEIACPLLVVWGADDALVPVAQADVYVDLVAGTRKEVFPDTGHMAMLERPAAFNRLVDGFLAG